MNTVFEPSLLLISNDDWQDGHKQDAFLSHLLDHLEAIETHNISNIWWTAALQTILVESPEEHPWYGSDLKNPLVVSIHQKFYSKVDYLEELFPPCQSQPPLKVAYSKKEAQTHFLCLVHALIDLEENFYCCVGLPNQLATSSGYTFSCDCHPNILTPFLLNHAKEWLLHLDAVEKYYPKNIEEFDNKFERGIRLAQQQLFPNKKILFECGFSKNFKKEIVDENKHQAAIFEAIAKKLTMTSKEAANSDLHDEFIEKRKEWRIRVTPRPSSTRIHYVLSGKTIQFLRYYGEGEHDDGL